MGSLLRVLEEDHLKRRLAPLLSLDIDPRAIVAYGLPAYKSYQFRKEPRLVRRLRKLAARPRRRRLVQRDDYILLGTFDETETWRFLDELWRSGLEYRRTERFRDFARRIEAGEAVTLHSKRRHMTSLDDLAPYFEEYVRLLESMRDHGYLATGARDRITVMIDRDGGILKETKGRHRLAAAQIVGAPSVPVRVSHVHAAWVDAQAAAAPAGTTAEDLVRRAVERALEAVARRPPLPAERTD